jgi:hypothetical protein
MSDDDLRDALPSAPPPSPARRESAIDAAMRRFDGLPPEPRARPAGEGRHWLQRPQFGVLVTVALMAVIGLPVAWLTVEHSKAPRQQPIAKPVANAPPSAVTPSAVTGAPGVSEVAAAPAPTSARRAGTLAARAMPDAQLAESPATPQSATRTADVAQRGAAADEGQKAARMASAPVESFAPMVAVPAAPAPPPPPPPPPPPAMAAAEPSAAGIAGRFASNAQEMVVAGARIAAPRGKRADMAACTIDDPRRNLSLCGSVLGISASGSAGVAASHVAEGLRRAWQEDLDGAAREFDTAIEIAPKLPAAYLNRSRLSSRVNANDRALADANKAVRYAPDSAQTYRVRAAVLRRLGKQAQADADERRADEIERR